MKETVRKGVATSVELAVDTYAEWRRVGAIRLGAVLALYSLAASALLVVVGVAIARIALGGARLEAELTAATRGVLGQDSAESFGSAAAGALQLSPTDGQLGLAALLVAVALVALAFQRAVDHVWRSEVPSSGSATVGGRLVAASAALFAALLVAVGLLLQSVDRLVGVFDIGLQLLAATLASTAALVLIVPVLFVAFKASVRVKVTWRGSASAASLAAEAIVVGTAALGLYARNVAAESTVGAVGGGILFLVWVVYVAQVLVLGVVVAKVLHRQATVSTNEDHRRDRNPATPIAGAQATP